MKSNPAHSLAAFLICLFSASASASLLQASTGILQIKDGYFWDPIQQEYFIPRGPAYQTWNPPVGANQSFAQMEYDLIEFKKMYANSIRCEFVWSQVEIEDDVYDWSKPDFLVKMAEELGFRLFVLIGFQYPPQWFPEEWYGINDRGERSDVLNYEHPEARRIYQDHITAVVTRYRDSPAIGGWILGNEYAYFDLWEDPAIYPNRRFLGYDSFSQTAFQQFLRSFYQGDITALNANWESDFPSFDSVIMPARYPSDRHFPGYHDLIQWRKQSVGDFVAIGARAAKTASPKHLVTYSMVGGIYNGVDANNTAEDGATIVDRCRQAGVPLDFWSVNNYAWAAIGNEMRSGDFGIAKYQEQTGLPIFVSETGHSSTETLLDPDSSERQAQALPSQIWEALLSGAIGVHFFHWNDRNMFTPEWFLRERGFGIVHENRLPKDPVYSNVIEVFRRLHSINIDQLLGGSANPPSDILFFWTVHSDMGWPRANQENAMLWGALKRLGYQPGLIDDAQFEEGAFKQAQALLLSRAYQMNPAHLEQIQQQVLPAGVHVHANADLPGQFNSYHQPNPGWTDLMRNIFGLETASAYAARDSGATNDPPSYYSLQVKGAGALGILPPSYSAQFSTWKIWHNLHASSGTTLATHAGEENSQASMPALHLKQHPQAKAIINTFALGDTYGGPPLNPWNIRYELLRAIYRQGFGITPAIELSGPGAPYVTPDYRICRNGSILIGLLNQNTAPASVTLSAPQLLTGKHVENLTHGSILTQHSSGVLEIALARDEYILLYAYHPQAAGPASSLINPNPNKLWFQSAPLIVWPGHDSYEVVIGYDVPEPVNLALSFASLHSPMAFHTQSRPLPISETGTAQITLPLPDLNSQHPALLASRDGGDYIIQAWIEKEGVLVSQTALPVRLAWPLRPHSLPPDVQPGLSYSVTLQWQELPSYLPLELNTPLNRARLWESSLALSEQYQVLLQLHSAGSLVAQADHLTREATGAHSFQITVPAGATGPFSWTAILKPVIELHSNDIIEGFEGRERGEQAGRLDPLRLLDPWEVYHYAEIPDQVIWQNEGVNLSGVSGGQAAFLVFWNPASSGAYSGFGMKQLFEETWELPDGQEQWGSFHFSAHFQEENRLPAIIELQLTSLPESDPPHAIHYIETYFPGNDGWHHIQASLDQFIQPDAFHLFDPSSVHALIVNVQMLQPDAQYVAFLDNIHFDGPDQVITTGNPFATYLTPPPSLVDSDGDGIPDIYETGTGIFVDATNTGTDPNLWDTDGDGVSDGDELKAGTNPLDPGDFFRISSLQRLPSGDVLLSWTAAPGRVYALFYSDTALPGAWKWLPVNPIRRETIENRTIIEVTDTTANADATRFYRLAVMSY